MTEPNLGRPGLSETVSTSNDPADRRAPVRQGPEIERARNFAVEAARLLHDSHCEDVLIYDVRGLSEITDFIVIASGTSDRQIKSAAGYINELARKHHIERFGSDRDEASTWLVLDYVELMIHLFEPSTRAHYDLEMMWGDAPQIEWQRPSG